MDRQRGRWPRCASSICSRCRRRPTSSSRCDPVVVALAVDRGGAPDPAGMPQSTPPRPLSNSCPRPGASPSSPVCPLLPKTVATPLPEIVVPIPQSPTPAPRVVEAHARMAPASMPSSASPQHRPPATSLHASTVASALAPTSRTQLPSRSFLTGDGSRFCSCS